MIIDYSALDHVYHGVADVAALLKPGGVGLGVYAKHVIDRDLHLIINMYINTTFVIIITLL